MLSGELLNIMRLFIEPSIYENFSTSLEIEKVINQLSLGQLDGNREIYVASCFFTAVSEALEVSVKKIRDHDIKLELVNLHNELKHLQIMLCITEEVQH
ncbi:hypothetical protein [Thalassotalea profundi]|uniref:Uncharacterized protein n=1 Tax=Thalassotalea profundi TaxID=2036687 RepID=A0ABQ3J7B2_9GAMM|nr:hypothetical protein [Thalassotalea profundi]GHF02639.1 hypothetical protein GCM10011501_34990 [Thalassotalea profundi]